MLREYEVEFLTYKEIAARHSVKVSQVRTILHGVRHKPQLLSKRMQQERRGNFERELVS